MKHFFKTCSLLFLLSQTCYASTVNLYIQNSSPTALTIIKSPGEKIEVPAYGYVENIPFEEFSQPKAFVNGQYSCTWGNFHSQDNLQLIGLQYDNPYSSKYECLTMFNQHI